MRHCPILSPWRLPASHSSVDFSASPGRHLEITMKKKSPTAIVRSRAASTALLRDASADAGIWNNSFCVPGIDLVSGSERVCEAAGMMGANRCRNITPNTVTFAHKNINIQSSFADVSPRTATCSDFYKMTLIPGGFRRSWMTFPHKHLLKQQGTSL